MEGLHPLKTYLSITANENNKYSSDMKEQIRKICTQLNDGQIAASQATEQLLDLFSVVVNEGAAEVEVKCNCKAGYLIVKDEFGATGNVIKCPNCT